MEFVCLNCGTHGTQGRNTTGKYCSNKCQHDHDYKRKVEAWLAGEELGWTGRSVQTKPFVRRWLFETRGEKCEECGWNKRHPVDNSILLEVDHIDGVATNCIPSNLKVLCPNCHAMTPTFRRRNNQSSRKR